MFVESEWDDGFRQGKESLADDILEVIKKEGEGTIETVKKICEQIVTPLTLVKNKYGNYCCPKCNAMIREKFQGTKKCDCCGVKLQYDNRA